MTPRARLVALAQSLSLGALVGVACGAASALFLTLLDRATALRGAHQQLIYALPIAGLALGWLYQRFGKSIEGGNNLIVDALHSDGPQLPLRMAPMVLAGTVLTHLFGGSAGREGTAVQMGGSLADALSHGLRVSRPLRRQLLAAGVAGGFGSVFGTPIAGAVFGLEFTVVGHLDYRSLAPALVAALAGDLTTRALGIVHTTYPAPAALALTPLLFLQWLAFAAAIAATAWVFIELTHLLRRQGTRLLPGLPLRMCLGGLLVVVLWRLSGTSDYLGLGIPTLLRAFGDPALPAESFALKLLFTAVTLGAGFLGGEVTPLFFIGAALGNLFGRLSGLPIPLCAGVGMAALFGAASNTPLALSIMAVELLSASVFPHVVIVCVVAWLLTGHRSIYPAQRLRQAKGGGAPDEETALRDLPPHLR